VTDWNFLGLPEERTRLDTARFVVLPIPYEETTTYQKGTASGPAAIVEASQQVELWDEELERETSDLGVFTAAPVPGGPPPAPEALHGLTQPEVARYLERDKFVLSLGGEHTISLGPILAHHAVWPDLGTLHFDAHGDLRDEYEGTKYGHGCVMRRVHEQGIPLVQCGIRAVSREEAELIRDSDRITTFYAHQARPLQQHIDAIVAALPQHVYVTVDVDGLDPSVMPGTGTPEPNGLGYREVLDVIRAVAEARTLVGADVNEVRPLAGHAQTEFAAARLAYRIMGYAAHTRGW
jgi:agmatinase